VSRYHFPNIAGSLVGLPEHSARGFDRDAGRTTGSPVESDRTKEDTMNESTPSAQELHARIREIIAGVLEVDEAEITEESSFLDDFDADSLQIIEMFSRFEKFLGVKVPNEGEAELNTLRQAYDLVAAHRHETVHA
jgi:acyl carrier protein